MKNKMNCRDRAVKGQLVFEFIIAAFILFAVIIYVLNFLSITVNQMHESFLASIMEGKALQISEVLMHDPVNGLASEWPMLSKAKMESFNTSCSDVDGYKNLLESFGVVEKTPQSEMHHVRILVNESAGREYVKCGYNPPPVAGLMYRVSSKATATRFGFVPEDDTIATVEVVVW
jgi:hypothetical protein